MRLHWQHIPRPTFPRTHFAYFILGLEWRDQFGVEPNSRAITSNHEHITRGSRPITPSRGLPSSMLQSRLYLLGSPHKVNAYGIQAQVPIQRRSYNLRTHLGLEPTATSNSCFRSIVKVVCGVHPLPPCTFLGYVRGLGAMFIFRIFRAIHRSLLHNSPFPPSTDT